MSKNKHLSLDDRSKIQLMLDNKESFSSIASSLGKDPSTISKEIRNHLQYRKVGAYHLPYNSCTKRVSCPKSHICTECHAARKYTLCRRCSMCNSLCKDFEKETCKRLLKPPYVCNGCGKRAVCSLEKGYTMLILPTGNTGMFFRKPDPVFLIQRKKSAILTNLFLR